MAAACAVTTPLMFVLFGTLISPFISSPHRVNADSGEFVGNFSGFVNGNVQDFSDFENDVDRLWYVARPSHPLNTWAVYLQDAASTALPSFTPVGASVPSTNLPSE